jgi:excisionase family DNA binding protein
VKVAMAQTVTVPRAAKIIGCSRSTVLRIVRDCSVRALKVGRCWFVDLNSIHEFERRKQMEVEARAARRG